MKIITHKMFREKHKGNEFERPERLVHFDDLPDTPIESGEKFLALAHSQSYIERCKRACESSLGFGGTPASPETYELACYGVGASIMASQMALDSRTGEGGFALVRPPGHHATYDMPSEDQGLGFCFLNDMGIVAKLLAKKGLRVFILDFDLHHGNGIQEAVFGNDTIRFLSVQQDGSWPWPFVKTDQSAGNCCNIVLPSGCKDDVYLSRLERMLIPLLRDFNPHVLGLYAGFDGYFKDFGALGDTYRAEQENRREPEGFMLTTRTYKRIREIASDYKHFAILGGGYNPESVKDGVKVFTG
jgi:acetoin utilization deacetylase AcuC-like enzyme